MALVVGTNSYISRADSVAYFTDRLEGAAWLALLDADKDKALISAADMIDRQDWQGQRFAQPPTQTMDWPRTGLTDQEGFPIIPATVLDFPQFLKDAQCQLALALSANPALATQTTSSGDPVKFLKAGSAEIEYFKSTAGTRFPTIVDELLGPYLEGSSRLVGLAPFLSDTSLESSLEDFGVTDA